MFNTDLGTLMKTKTIKKIKPKTTAKGDNGSTAIKAKGIEGCLPIK